MVDKYTVYTYLDWEDKSRPEVQIHGTSATVHAGGHHQFEINCKSTDELKDLLEDYAQIFKAAADSL